MVVHGPEVCVHPVPSQENREKFTEMLERLTKFIPEAKKLA
ncbi:MAG: hypothetical protein QHH09_00120 [Microgenomates group bacterium]|nr:hypothetical protein [Microgenomates group bacterium]